MSASNLFDDISRIVASPISRRRAFRLIVGGLAGAALGHLGVKRAWAAFTTDCKGVPNDGTLCGPEVGQVTGVCIGGICCPTARACKNNTSCCGPTQTCCPNATATGAKCC